MRRLQFFSRSVASLVVFGAGLLIGRATLPVAPEAPVEDLVQVEMTGPEAAAEPKRATTTKESQQVDAAPLNAKLPSTEIVAAGPLSPRMIARRALENTVYLRGGRVYGAGVLIDNQGHILTADHVVEGVENMQATFHEEPSSIPVRVIERDGKLDLALLRLERMPVGKQPARFGSIVDVSMGDEVFSMGAPRKMQFSLNRGIVSYVGRAFDGTLYVQTDLTANSGSSGGPVLNDRGELIGIASFILRNSQGLAFAVPIDYAVSRFSALAHMRHGDAFDGWLAARRPTPEHPSPPDMVRHANATRPASD